MMTTYEAALKYLGMGFPVIPLIPKSKKPALQSWKEFQARMPTEKEAAGWFKNTSNNIGIVTGNISGITVVDCDSAEAVRLASELGLPTCPTVKTGNGYHFFYSHEDGVRNFQKRDDLPGVDLRAEGGYVVAPPSLHPNGMIYEWEGMDRELPPLPGWVLAKKGNSSHKEHISGIYTGAKEGNRNNSLARITGLYCKMTKNLSDIMQMAKGWNTQNIPPLPEDEVERTVFSIYQAEQSKQDTNTSANPTGIISVESLYGELQSLYDEGLSPGDSTGWKTLDEYYTVKRGEMTVITGIPNSGKTVWLDALILNLARHMDWKFGMFSAENLPFKRHLATLVSQYSGMRFMKYGPTERMKKVHKDAAAEFLNDHLHFLMPENRTVENIIAQAKALNDLRPIDGIVIDPWNEIDHSRAPGMSETEHISNMLTKIREMARSINAHVWVVAHPAKMYKKTGEDYSVPTAYDISGSANFRNKADNCITVWRDFSGHKTKTEIYVQKIRFSEIGRIGMAELYFDRVTSRYFESEYERDMAR